MPYSVIVENVGKRFARFDPRRPRTLQETVQGGWAQMNQSQEFWALRNVSFKVEPGQMLGIIGANGAGKSTLLRLVGRVGRPDTGSVRLNGRVGALLELGAGFHPDLTGRENAYVAGVLQGLTRKQVSSKMEQITEFAELEGFLDNPLRTYSSGMQMRLAFSIAAHCNPSVLLVDEVLAVGDVRFQRKCLHRIEEFKSNGCAILLVSHDPAVVQRLCDQVLWLRNGQVAGFGPTDEVVRQYVQRMTQETRARTPSGRGGSAGTDLKAGENRFGSLEAEITSVRILDALGLPLERLTTGQPLRVQVDYSAGRPIISPILGVTVSRYDGTVCCDLSTMSAGMQLARINGKGTFELKIDRLDLAAGSYYVDVGIYEGKWEYAYDYHWHVYPLSVDGEPAGKGLLDPPHHWHLPNLQVLCNDMPLDATNLGAAEGKSSLREPGAGAA